MPLPPNSKDLLHRLSSNPNGLSLDGMTFFACETPDHGHRLTMSFDNNPLINEVTFDPSGVVTGGKRYLPQDGTTREELMRGATPDDCARNALRKLDFIFNRNLDV